MKTRMNVSLMLALPLTIVLATLTMAAQAKAGRASTPPRPQGPCDIYASGGDPCVAAHSTTRALYASYNGPLYQVLRQTDGKTLDIGVVQPVASPVPDAGGYADAAAQDAFCANTYCWISILYDQSGHHNDLTQAPRGHFSGPAMGGYNNLPIADMAPITIMGHKAYGIMNVPGMGLRLNDAKQTAVDDQAEGTYWVVNGKHYNNGCCYDYGNAEIDGTDDGNGTMETTYFGNTTGWIHGPGAGPWIMTDQENNLAGCVGGRVCPDLPTITDWRFVTAMAKGKPHHWSTLGGDAQKGKLAVMFDGPRINFTYDPMRKQGAILLGNGGDNSNSSQGTFYEGAMTVAGTYPTNETDQLVQANVVAAGYGVQQVSMAPAEHSDAPPGLQTFSPGSTQKTLVTFQNTTGAGTENVKFSISVPAKWTSTVTGNTASFATIAHPVPAGGSISVTFDVTSGPEAFNGDMVAHVSWTGPDSGGKRSEATIAEKVRNAAPVKINEFRVSTASPANPTNSFIELYNAGTSVVDLSNWTLTEHPSEKAIFSQTRIPSGKKLAPGGFYLLGLSSSGLAVPAHAGDSTLYLRSTAGMSAGDTISIASGSGVETHKIAKMGTPAGGPTTLWEPLPEGPVITIPAGSTNVPVMGTGGFFVGQKMALGYGATYPIVGRVPERYEVATVTAIGKPGTQAYLGADAAAGATNIKVTWVRNISVGDKIRLDIDSKDHGIETVTVTHVGTESIRTALDDDAGPGDTKVKLRGRDLKAFATGDKLIVGTPANLETVTITAVGTPGRGGSGVEFTPALAQKHVNGEDAVNPGTGLDLAEPLKLNHAANLPFSDRGTGITFEPATAFVHSSDEPVMALGTGVTLDSPLTNSHPVDAVVEDATDAAAGYQGTPAPDQWFGGPALSPSAGNMVLRDAAGLVVDSLNYGLVVDPWAAKGYQGLSGAGKGGCRVIASPANASAGTSAGRFPDGHDTDSNCNDFAKEPATFLTGDSTSGATSIKVADVTGFEAGQTITIDVNANAETAVIENVGTSGPAGSGITLTAALSKAHNNAPRAPVQVSSSFATPGAPNHYYQRHP